jgi:protein-tyrosine-phosphatase
MSEKISILFLDTYNITLSIIAESYLRRVGSNLFNISSACISQLQMDNFSKLVYKSTLEVLSESMMPIMGLSPTDPVENYLFRSFDYVITMSEKAKIECPMFTGTYIRCHWEFPMEEIPPLNTPKEKIIETLRLSKLMIINKLKPFISSFLVRSKQLF